MSVGISERVAAGAKLGLELEMPVAGRADGASVPVRDYFERLAGLRRERGQAAALVRIGEVAVGVSGPLGESGLDNGFNLLETAFAPVAGGAGGLDRLDAAVREELADVRTALAADAAFVLNASEHPDCTLDEDWYRRVRVPRPIYRELAGYRGWLHRAGIDAKAQNGPCTAIPVREAVRALNVSLALAPALMALYANSPLQAGRETGLKENRMTLWDRMFRHARFAGDHFLQQLPERPFRDLGDHFRWMYGAGTASRALSWHAGDDYKSAVSVYLEGDPALGRFLRAAAWAGRRGDTGERVMLAPRAEHFVYSQFAHFLDARWRYRLARTPALPDLLAAWDRPGGLEALFEACGCDGYIEARAFGAVFPDAQLLREAGADVGAGVILGASALQLGLLANLDEAEALVRQWGWLELRGLRAPAIRHALDDARVRALCGEVLAVAQAGLAPADRHWLRYPRYVVESGTTAADLQLRLWRSAPRAAFYRERALQLPG